MKSRRYLCALALAAAMLAPDLAAAQQPGGPAPIVMKITSVTFRDPVHAYMDEFKTRIEAASKGRIKAEVYPNSQLGSIDRLIEGLQLGTIEMLVSATAQYSRVNPAFQVTDAPGLFVGTDHAHRAITDPMFRDKYLALGESKGIVGIGTFIYGGTHYPSSKPLRSVADFRNKKVRIFGSKIEVDTMAALGAAGVPIAMGEMALALQQGTIDAMRSSVVVSAGLKHFSVAKFITLLDESVIQTGGFVSKAFLDKLPADLRKEMLDLGPPLTVFGRNAAIESDRRAAAMWRENGAEVIAVSAADRAELSTRLLPVAESLLGGNPQTKEMWELLKAAAAKHRGTS